MAWHLNRALSNFRAAVNAAYPGRDKGSDGTIGDTAHQQGSSDHNPDRDGSVDAWDMDVDLRSGDDAAAIAALKRVFQAHPAARYWIHNRQMAHRNTGWRRVPYSGPNPHTQHVHWNTNQATEDSTAPWDLEDDMKADERLWLRDSHYALTAVPMPDGSRRPAHVVLGELAATVAAIAGRVDIDPDELAAIKSAAVAGAQAGAVEGVTAAADSIAAAVVARLPQEALTLDAVRDAVAAELAERLAA